MHQLLGEKLRPIGKFIDWLSFHPSPHDISRTLVTEYFSEFNACRARLSRLNSDDTLTFIADYGYKESIAGQSFPGTEWRSWDGDGAKIALQVTPGNWNVTSTMILLPLRDHGAIHGYATLEFDQAVIDKELIDLLFGNICSAISVYFSGNRIINDKNRADTRSNETSALTIRQRSILKGMVEGKTNHELAREMGFSGSTVRHETMRIFEALAVSDRKEAAAKAIALKLV